MSLLVLFHQVRPSPVAAQLLPEPPSARLIMPHGLNPPAVASVRAALPILSATGVARVIAQVAGEATAKVPGWDVTADGAVSALLRGMAGARVQLPALGRAVARHVATASGSGAVGMPSGEWVLRASGRWVLREADAVRQAEEDALLAAFLDDDDDA